MYDKGQLVLNTLRSVINNDSLWFSILRGLAETFKYQTIAAEDVFRFVNKMAGKDYTSIFDQYLKHARIPQLEVYIKSKGGNSSARYRWKADVADFSMPVKVSTSRKAYEFIFPTTSWHTMNLGDLPPEQFRVAEDLFYIGLKLNWTYIDPRTKD
jgi:aminopeptidase N